MSAQSSSVAGAERDLRPIEVDVVARPQLGHALLAGAEAQRRRRADRDLVERDPRRGGLRAQIGERLRFLPRDRPQLRPPTPRDTRGRRG